jgi:hypothetical protein
MKAYVLMWGQRVCKNGIAAMSIPENPDIWFDLRPLAKYASYDITTDYKYNGWWLLELEL